MIDSECKGCEFNFMVYGCINQDCEIYQEKQAELKFETERDNEVLGGVRMFLVMAVIRNASMEMMGTEFTFPLSFGKGSIGVAPVFDNLEEAKDFAGDKYKIVAVREAVDALHK